MRAKAERRTGRRRMLRWRVEPRVRRKGASGGDHDEALIDVFYTLFALRRLRAEVYFYCGVLARIRYLPNFGVCDEYHILYKLDVRWSPYL